MPIYDAPVRDMQFVLHDVLQVSTLDIPGYDELDRDFTAAVLTEAGRLATEVLAPLNRVGDEQGCRLENGVVRTPDGFRAAYDEDARGRLDRPRRGSRVRRPGHALRHELGHGRDVRLRQHGLQHVSGPLPRGLQRDPRPRQRGAARDLPAADDRGALVGHHEPHRAAMRHRSGPDPHPRRAAGRRKPTASPARRSGSRPASTTSPTT